jgi:hypothetical protein
MTHDIQGFHKVVLFQKGIAGRVVYSAAAMLGVYCLERKFVVIVYCCCCKAGSCALPAGLVQPWRESKIPDLIRDVLARVYYGWASPGLRPGQAGPFVRYSCTLPSMVLTCCIAWLGQPGMCFACAAGTHFLFPNQVRDLRLDQKVSGTSRKLSGQKNQDYPNRGPLPPLAERS